MKLQNILLPKEQICAVEELYFHRRAGRVDFDGYFNLFYLEKHHKYTTLTGLSLELSVRGASALVLMHDRQEIGRRPLNSGKEETIRVEFPYAVHAGGVFWFALETAEAETVTIGDVTDGEAASPALLLRGFFDGAAERTRAVEIAVAVTTYRREAYVLRNFQMLAALPGEIREHMHVLLIDNGRTIRAHGEIMALIGRCNEAGREYIRLIENANTGGCGGFTRGMREAIAQRAAWGLTHLLLMDDDAVFDPDLFTRLFGILATLREEYRDITVGGAMWLLDTPWVQFAAGEWFEQFHAVNHEPLLDLRDFDNCRKETMTGTANERHAYSGWWCCCFSMAVITEENLPLPLFIHHDDIQFGMRHADLGVLFLNGIGVWHQSFEFAFHGVKQYYNARNTLITTALFEPKKRLGRIWFWAVHYFVGRLLVYGYAEVSFIYQGILDFLKGPAWLVSIDPEKKNEELLAYWNAHTDIRPLEELLGREAYEAFEEKYLNGERRRQLAEAFQRKADYRAPLSKYLSLNGWFLPSDPEPAFLSMAEMPWVCYRKKRVLAYDFDRRTGEWRKRSWKEFFKLLGRIVLITVRLAAGYQKQAAAYRRTVGLQEKAEARDRTMDKSPAL